MALTKKQEKQLNNEIKKTLEEVRFQGLKAGAAGILGAVLDMCNQGKTVEDIKQFCEKSLNMKEMFYKFVRINTIRRIKKAKLELT